MGEHLVAFRSGLIGVVLRSVNADFADYADIFPAGTQNRQSNLGYHPRVARKKKPAPVTLADAGIVLSTFYSEFRDPRLAL
jgi:hypothetical protein